MRMFRKMFLPLVVTLFMLIPWLLPYFSAIESRVRPVISSYTFDQVLVEEDRVSWQGVFTKDRDCELVSFTTFWLTPDQTRVAVRFETEDVFTLSSSDSIRKHAPGTVQGQLRVAIPKVPIYSDEPFGIDISYGCPWRAPHHELWIYNPETMKSERFYG